MNETERLLKLQNAVKMMVADGKTPAYIDTFLAKQNSSPEEIKAINTYGAENIAKSREQIQQTREALPSNSLLSNMLTPEALKEAAGGGIYSLEEGLNAATAGGYGWLNEKLGGDFDKRQERYQQILDESPRWLRNIGRAGRLTSQISGGVASPIYKLNLIKGAGVGPRIANMAAQAGIYGGLNKAFEEDSLQGVPKAALQNAAVGGALGALLIGVPAGLAKTGGISSGAGAETTTLARKAGEAGGTAAKAFKAGRNASGLEIADELDDAYRAIDRQSKQAFGAGKNAIDTQAINKDALKQSFKDWKKTNFTPYGRKNLATPEEQKVFNQANKLLKKFVNRKGDMILGEGHALKNAIGNISAERGSAAERVRTELYNIVKNNLNESVPEYAQLMKPYAEAKDTLLAIKQATGAAGRDMTSVQKSNITKRLVNSLKNPTVRGAIEKVAGPDFSSKLAGFATKSWVPETSISRLGAASALAGSLAGAPQILTALPFLSPRIMGNMSYGIGRAQSVMPSTENILRTVQAIKLNND
jgi:hypothetical protein